MFDLVDFYPDKARHIYFDNYYFKQQLSKDLRARQTFASGTNKIDREYFLKAFKHCELAKAETTFIKNGSSEMPLQCRQCIAMQ